jgi:hypothetical protein
VKVLYLLRSGRCLLESGFVAGQIVSQKLTEIDKTGWRKITSSQSAAAIFRNILHPNRQLAKVRLVVTGEWSTEKT